MSIWSSIPGAAVLALNGADHDANYAAEGEPLIEVDVATTGHHDHVRLSLCEGGVDVDALLSPDAACALRDRLDAALGARHRTPNVHVSMAAPVTLEAIARDIERVLRRYGHGRR